jgi:hypothetical protein
MLWVLFSKSLSTTQLYFGVLSHHVTCIRPNVDFFPLQTLLNSNRLGLFDLTGKVPVSCSATAAAVSARDSEILRLKEELVSACF